MAKVRTQLSAILEEVQPFLGWLYEQSDGRSFVAVDPHAYRQQAADVTAEGIDWLCEHLAQKKCIKVGACPPLAKIYDVEQPEFIALTTKGLKNAEHAFRRADVATVKPPLKGKPGLVQTPSAGQRPTHSMDFTSVNWFGTRYVFRRGKQCDAIERLWAEFEKGGLGLAEKTIGALLESNDRQYRLSHTFRSKTKGRTTMHPAWGTMIKRISPGVYRLEQP